jgi:hypothetical protein
MNRAIKYGVRAFSPCSVRVKMLEPFRTDSISAFAISFGTETPQDRYRRTSYHMREVIMGRGILLWMLGVPIPVIILLALLWH